jgi:hypothetical protein
MSPYASVIIPTHNRAATLATAVASVQRQTVSDIEILIVGDGPTPDVAAAAEALASMDRRVQFLPFEKAPADGGLNIDRAIRQARSERIFYNDDDDVWLPQHVETLGPALDHAHIVDTLPVSVGVIAIGGEQRLHGTLVNSGNERVRQLLAEARLKLTFDTHVAHRRSSYVKLGSPRVAASGLSINAFLAAFASARSIRWTTLPTATALSLHGAARVSATPSERRIEIDTWLARSASWTPSALLERIDFAWHLVRTMFAEAPRVDDTVSGYLARYGIAWDQTSAPDADAGRRSLAIPFTSQQRRAVEWAFASFQGHLNGNPSDATLLSLLDCVLGATSVALALKILKPSHQSAALDICARLRKQRPEAAFLLDLLETYLMLGENRNTAPARAKAERLATEDRLPPFDRTRLLVECDLAERASDAAIRRLQQAWSQKTAPIAAGLELAQLLMMSARAPEATALCRDLEGRVTEPLLTQMMTTLDRMWTELEAIPPYQLAPRGALRMPDGTSAATSRQIDGAVDAVHLEGEFAFFRGWAVDRAARQPAQHVVVVIDGRAHGVATPALSRPDIAAALRQPGAEMSGYLMAARLPTGSATLPDLRAFAISAGRARELKLPANCRPRRGYAILRWFAALHARERSS